MSTPGSTHGSLTSCRSSSDEIHKTEQIDRDTLVDLRAMASEFRSQVHPLDVPRNKAQKAFFINAHCESAERVDEVVGHTLNDLKELTSRIKSSFDLVQLQLTEMQGQKAEAFQQRLGVLAAVFLAPT